MNDQQCYAVCVINTLSAYGCLRLILEVLSILQSTQGLYMWGRSLKHAYTRI